MHIDKYKLPDGSFSYNDSQYDDVESLILSGMLGFCGCGLPVSAMRYIRDALAHIERLRDAWDGKITLAEWDDEGGKLFAAEGAECFTLYVMDKLGLTEHGSSVHGCWLTDFGKDLLEDLNELLKE